MEALNFTQMLFLALLCMAAGYGIFALLCWIADSRVWQKLTARVMARLP